MKRFEEEREKSLQGWFMHVFHAYMSVNFATFQGLGIHPGQLPFLKVISEQEGISQRELAERTHVKPPTVAVTVKRLERAGLIRRETDKHDMRVSRIYLDRRGRELSDGIRSALQETEAALTAGFSKEELEQLKGYFRRMTENLEALEKSRKRS